MSPDKRWLGWRRRLEQGGFLVCPAAWPSPNPYLISLHFSLAGCGDTVGGTRRPCAIREESRMRGSRRAALVGLAAESGAFITSSPGSVMSRQRFDYTRRFPCFSRAAVMITTRTRRLSLRWSLFTPCTIQPRHVHYFTELFKSSIVERGTSVKWLLYSTALKQAACEEILLLILIIAL